MIPLKSIHLVVNAHLRLSPSFLKRMVSARSNISQYIFYILYHNIREYCFFSDIDIPETYLAQADL